jgi:hypothetical protein
MENTLLLDGGDIAYRAQDREKTVWTEFYAPAVM